MKKAIEFAVNKFTRPEPEYLLKANFRCECFPGVFCEVLRANRYI